MALKFLYKYGGSVWLKLVHDILLPLMAFVDKLMFSLATLIVNLSCTKEITQMKTLQELLTSP